MKIIAFKLFITVGIIISTVYFTHTLLYSNNVYEITYNTYVYSSNHNSLIVNTQNEKYTVRAHTEIQAKELTKDMLYLNKLCVSDKVVFVKVVEL